MNNKDVGEKGVINGSLRWICQEVQEDIRPKEAKAIRRRRSRENHGRPNRAPGKVAQSPRGEGQVERGLQESETQRADQFLFQWPRG